MKWPHWLCVPPDCPDKGWNVFRDTLCLDVQWCFDGSTSTLEFLMPSMSYCRLEPSLQLKMANMPYPRSGLSRYCSINC